MTDDAFDRIARREREERRERRRAHARWGFRCHATFFAAVNAALVVAWLTAQLLLEGDQPMWFLPPLVGWGTALAIHRYAVRGAYREPPSPGPGAVSGSAG